MNNSLCFVGPHRKYNPFSNQYHELVPGQGHFGPDAIPGVSAAWRSLGHHHTTQLIPYPCYSLCTLLTVSAPSLSQDARWRRGEAVSLKAARDNMVSLEAAAHAQMFMTKRM